ncbi:hypothetical protein BDW27_101264 [Nocardiopsis sp. L17-MgMaSL7]|nr:hypothetical protein BDW27_101264 [Nocardiopsis sp. L17-MgMaSL7]
MPLMLLIVAGCALACAWPLWILVDFYNKMISSSEEERLKDRNDVLAHVAAVAAGGSASMALLVFALAEPESTGEKVLLALLTVEAIVCAACVWWTGYLDQARHWSRIRELLTGAKWTAIASVFLALVGAVTHPDAQETVDGVVDTVGAILEGLLILGAIIVAIIVGVGFGVLMSWEDPDTPKRPKGMSKQVWNRQQRQWREYKRKHGIDRSGGAGYSGDGGDGGGGGD